MSDQPTGEIQPVPTGPMAVVGDGPICAPPDSVVLLQRAIDAGLPVETMREFLAMKREMDADAAAKAFAEAKAQFDIDCPPIVRRTDNTQFKTTTHDGRQCYRRYADLEDIDTATKGPLAKNGLCYSWGDAVVEGDMLTIKCVLSHRGGHREQSAVTFPVSSQAGSSPQQKYATAITYAQRYSLIGVLGLTTCEDDMDGNDPSKPAEPIAPDQVKAIWEAINETGANIDGFLDYFHIKTLEALPMDRLDEATRMLDEKRRQLAAKAAEGAQP